MGIQQQGQGGQLLQVDASHRAARFSARPLDHGTLGHYRLGVSTGLLAGAGVTAGGTLFSARWTDATRLAVITRLSAYYAVTTVFTAVQEIGLDAIIARSFTAADSSGTAITLGGNNQKMRTNMGTSLFTSAAEVRIGATSIVTAGTRTLDANAMIGASGITHDLNAAAATVQLIATPKIGFDWVADPSIGEHPVVLAQNEGVVVRNTVVFPAAGAARLWVQMVWAEVASYDNAQLG